MGAEDCPGLCLLPPEEAVWLKINRQMADNQPLLRLSLHWTVVSFFSGLVGSLLGTRLLQEIQWGHRYHAVGLEGLTVLAGIVGWQIWASREHDPKVLFIEGVGTLLGTWIVLS